MNYGEFKNYVLQLLDRYSVAGTAVPPSYCNQADLLARLPALADDALVCLATTACRLRASAALTNGTAEDGWTVYALPEDCWQLCADGVYRPGEDGVRVRDGCFRLLGGGRIAFPDDSPRTAEYFRYPRALGPAPADDAALDCPREAAPAAAFYAAAQLVLQDEPNAHAALYNEFETRLSRLGELPAALCEPLQNDYETGGAE